MTPNELRSELRTQIAVLKQLVFVPVTSVVKERAIVGALILLLEAEMQRQCE